MSYLTNSLFFVWETQIVQIILEFLKSVSPEVSLWTILGVGLLEAFIRWPSSTAANYTRTQWPGPPSTSRTFPGSHLTVNPPTAPRARSRGKRVRRRGVAAREGEAEISVPHMWPGLKNSDRCSSGHLEGVPSSVTEGAVREAGRACVEQMEPGQVYEVIAFIDFLKTWQGIDIEAQMLFVPNLPPTSQSNCALFRAGSSVVLLLQLLQAFLLIWSYSAITHRIHELDAAGGLRRTGNRPVSSYSTWAGHCGWLPWEQSSNMPYLK